MENGGLCLDKGSFFVNFAPQRGYSIADEDMEQFLGYLSSSRL
jgi:hypothetical protein